MSRTRTLVVATAAACVAALWGMLANTWLVGHDRIGLMGVEMCADYCEVKSWSDLHAPSELFWLAGLTLLGAIHTIGFSVHALAQLHRDRRERIRVGWTIASAASTIIPGVIFVVRAHALLRGESASVGYAPFVTAAGVIPAAVPVWRLRSGR